MGRHGKWRAALATVGAAAGTGFASGRQIACFFAQLGWASWAGIALAAAVFALLTGLCASLARRSGASGFASLCRRRLGRAGSRAAGLCHGLLLALVAALMLLNAGKLGALTLPMRHGFAWGMALALALAGAAALGWRRALPALGLALVAVGAAFYAGMALDPRPPRLYLTGEATAALAGSLPATAALALGYAALNACVAADAACRFAGSAARPARTGALCGVLLALPVAWGNLAIARGGALLLAHALPTVPLAARWGLFGFWLCAGFGFACDTATLAAARAALAAWMRRAPGGGAPEKIG